MADNGQLTCAVGGGGGVEVGSAKLTNPQLLLSHICGRKREGNTGRASRLVAGSLRISFVRLHSHISDNAFTQHADKVQTQALRDAATL